MSNRTVGSASVVFALLPLLVFPPFLFSGPTTVASGTYDLGTAYNSEKKVVSDQNGNLFVAYSTLASNGSYFVEVAMSSDGGESWSQISGVPAGPSSSKSAIALARDGTLGLVWTEGVTEFSQIYFSAYKGGSWSSKVLLSNSRYYSGYPSIAADSKGFFHVVWYGFDGISYQIYYTKWNGSAWSAPFDLSALKQDSLNPTIAIDPADNIYVAWYAEVVHNYQIFYTYFSGNWSRTIPLTVATVGSANPSLVLQPNGLVNLVWVSTIDGIDQVFTMSGTKGSWEDRHQLTNGTDYAFNPTQTFTQNGTEFVFWIQGNGLYGCAFVTSCSPRAVFTEGYNAFPIAESDPTGRSDTVAIMWSHSQSSQQTQDSVLFARLGSTQAPPSPWTGSLAVLAMVLVLGAYLLASRGPRRRSPVRNS